jgi:dipeptidyl aminopeptidase/acylaminoacyl peptidase
MALAILSINRSFNEINVHIGSKVIKGSRMLRLLFAGVIFVWLSVQGIAASGEPNASNKPAHASDSTQIVRYFSQVSMAPDGRFMVWSELERGSDTSRSPESALYLADLRSPASRPRHISVGVGKGRSEGHDPVWSPDGTQLAFLCDSAKKSQPQIYVISRAGGAPKQLTHLTCELSNLRWSPDGKHISYLFIENAPRAAGPTSAVPPQTGLVGEQTFVQRIGTVDVGSGQTRKLSPPDLYVYEYTWSHDSRRLAAIAAHPPGDDNWYVAQLYTLALPSGAMQSILKTSMQIAGPSWSPDDKSIAFIGGLMSDEGLTGGEIFSVSVTGGTPKNLTPSLPASAAWLTWLPSGRILFTEQIDGGSGICALDPTSGRVETLWTGGESIAAQSRNNISIAGDEQTTALVRQTFQRPPEIWTGPIGSWRPLTHSNAQVTPQWGKAQSLHWKSDPFTIQGWLLYPKDYQEKRRYPMVVMPHGGPAWQYQPTFGSTRFFHPTEFSRHGYFVFLPNPRGSYGQGERFTRGNIKDFGYGDLRDVLSGVDEVLKTYPVDQNRLGVTGWSYGGYMTMWTVTQTTRFRAAVAGAGIANWHSYYGENGIDQWMIPYFGASVYDDPAVYAKSSPINFIKQVKTPTLIVVGEYDQECPAPQSYEFWHGLKTCGVPTELVVYPKEGHFISKPEHERDIMNRLMGWFDKYLGK